MTEAQKSRTEKMLKGFAGEPVTLETIKGVLYAFASELGCLRIFANYNANGSAYNQNVRVGFSENLGTWFVSIEL